MKALLLATLATILTGCSPQRANLAANPALTQLGLTTLNIAIRYGVTDYLTKHPGAIGRTKAIADGLLAVLNSDTTTTVAALKAFAYSKIPADMAPLDQQDARTLIDSIAAVVAARVGTDGLNGRALIDLRDVLGTISYAVASYSPAG